MHQFTPLDLVTAKEVVINWEFGTGKHWIYWGKKRQGKKNKKEGKVIWLSSMLTRKSF